VFSEEKVKISYNHADCKSNSTHRYLSQSS